MPVAIVVLQGLGLMACLGLGLMLLLLELHQLLMYLK